MNYTDNLPCNNIRLYLRDEGKLKTFESCSDLRAWSHDSERKDQYLREWIKCDAPVSVIPASTLLHILRRMTCCSKGQVTPRCHPQCKSKVVLDSICNSCHAMRQCFKNEEGFNKYFDDEEFETSHWPCERYLEALKSIKMFWKIIVEKLFNLNVSKSVHLEETSNRADSVQSVVRVWQTDMVQQAMFVKNITPLLNRNTCSWKGKKCPKKPEVNPGKLKICAIDDCGCSQIHPADALRSVSSSRTRSCKMTNTSQRLSSSTIDARKPITLSSHSRQTAPKPRTADFGCECTRLVDEINTYKANLDMIQEKFQTQKEEIETLKKENGSLKVELQNIYKNSWWKSCFQTPPSECSNKTQKQNARESFSKPFDDCPCEGKENGDCDAVKPIDSEMIITMKNCKNENYRYISLLQVLHKTNAPIKHDLTENETCCKREDPIELLTKVQNTFGAIVQREMSLANDKRCCPKTFDIDATYHKLNASKSEPSCSMTTLTSYDSRFDMRLTQEM